MLLGSIRWFYPAAPIVLTYIASSLNLYFTFFRVLVEIMVDLFQHDRSYLDGFLVPAVNRGAHCSVIAYIAKSFKVYIPVYGFLTDYQVLMKAIRSPNRGAADNGIFFQKF